MSKKILMLVGDYAEDYGTSGATFRDIRDIRLRCLQGHVLPAERDQVSAIN